MHALKGKVDCSGVSNNITHTHYSAQSQVIILVTSVIVCLSVHIFRLRRNRKISLNDLTTVQLSSIPGNAVCANCARQIRYRSRSETRLQFQLQVYWTA